MSKQTTDTNTTRKPTFDPRPDAVQAWVAGLPIANLGETSRRLYTALIELNDRKLNPNDRFEILTQMTEPVGYTVEAMDKHFIGKPFPLEDKYQQVARLSQALTLQFGIGYQIAASDQLQKRGFRKDSQLTGQALYHAMAWFGHTLVRTYQVYGPFPKGIWRRIHTLYALAEANKLHGLSVESDDEPKRCVASAYKRILLLALACPYRLRQNETAEIYQVLEDWSDEAKISELAERDNPNGLFVTNLDGDEPPFHLMLRHAEYNQPSYRLLDTDQLPERLQTEVGEIRKSASTSSTKRTNNLSEPTLRRLMLSWGVMSKRQYSRSKKQSPVSVAVGLSAAHYFVSGEVAFKDPTPAGRDTGAGTQTGDSKSLFAARSHFESKPVASQSKAKRDIWETGGERLDKIDPVDIGDGTIEFVVDKNKQPVTPEYAEYKTEQWNMANMSAGGCCLNRADAESSDAQVGELIAIRQSSDPDTFHMELGVVRWMRSSRKLGLQLGVQMLSPGAVAVGIKHIRPDGSTTHYIRALLLPEIKSIGLSATLLTPTIPYRTGATVIVNRLDKESEIKLTRLVENTGCLSQFEFKSLDESLQAAQDPAEATPEDFEHLWDMI